MNFDCTHSSVLESLNLFTFQKKFYPSYTSMTCHVDASLQSDLFSKHVNVNYVEVAGSLIFLSFTKNYVKEMSQP